MIHYDDLAGVVCKESDNQDPARPSRSRDGGRPSEFPAQLLLPRHRCQRGCQEGKSVAVILPYWEAHRVRPGVRESGPRSSNICL